MPEPKCDASGRKARCHVADAFLTRLKLIWPISSLKISKMFKKAFGQKAPGVNGLTKYTVQTMKYKLQAENK